MDLVLHIGAHRTGSTHVERAITATIAAHPTCGVAMWAPRRLRDMTGFQKTVQQFDDDFEPVDKAAAVALDKLASDVARGATDEKARGIKTLILSEENFMGGMRYNFRKRAFYPDVARRLAAFDSLLPMSPKVVALGVRDYGSVWTSAYQYLPQAGQKPPPVDKIRGVLLDNERGWPDVVNAIKQVWPVTKIVMWRQEDLEDNTREICATIAGIDADLIVIPDGKINARKAQMTRPEVFTTDELKDLSTRYNFHVRRLQDDKAVHWATAS